MIASLLFLTTVVMVLASHEGVLQPEPVDPTGRNQFDLFFFALLLFV
jgi:hypothetical protein